jgi:general secretion pathway protein B
MSLILEALRKSEAERRRGQTPDLLSDAVPVAPATRGATPHWRVLAMVAGAALATLLLVLWWLRPSPSNDAMREPATIATGIASTATTEGAKPPAQGSLAPPVASVRTRTPPPAPLPRPMASPPSTQTPATTAISKPPEVAPAVAAPQPAPPPVQAASIEPRSPVSASVPDFASPDAPVKLSDLSTEDRQQLPALKVSMHMWAPDAGSRFAIIDGARVNEGDRVGNATVEAIQQDSVMLSWQGRHIRLPIR